MFRKYFQQRENYQSSSSDSKIQEHRMYFRSFQVPTTASLKQRSGAIGFRTRMTLLRWTGTDIRVLRQALEPGHLEIILLALVGTAFMNKRKEIW